MALVAEKYTGIPVMIGPVTGRMLRNDSIALAVGEATRAI